MGLRARLYVGPGLEIDLQRGEAVVSAVLLDQCIRQHLDCVVEW